MSGEGKRIGYNSNVYTNTALKHKVIISYLVVRFVSN